MPVKFEYKAVAGDGTITKGAIAADSREQVVEQLSDRQLVPITVQRASDKQSFSLLGFFKGSLYEDLIMFTNSLGSLYRAGIPILRALDVIKIGPPESRFNQAIGQIRSGINAGLSLSEAMSKHQDVFSKVYINSVAAGEESGKLEAILDELSIVLEKDLELSRQIKSGIRYPIMVLAAISMAFIVLITYVIPKFVTLYESFGAELPLPTRILLEISNFMTNYWSIVIVGTAGLVYGLKRFIGHPKGKAWLDRRLLRVPVFGQLIIKGNIARFAMMFHILFRSGLPIVKCFRVLADSVKNDGIRSEIQRMEELFHRGSESDLTQEPFEFIPDLAMQMISIGLESGSLDSMLAEVGSHYSKEVQYTSRHLTSILEPMLTLVVSAMMLLMALAIFLPMWNLINVFKNG